MRLALALCLLPFPALADACSDRLATQIAAPKILSQPYEVMQTVDLGGQKLVVHQKYLGDRHYQSITLEPAGTPDTLYHEGGTYTSDGKGGWTLAYSVDADQEEQIYKESRVAQAASIISAVCTQEVQDGKPVDRIDGILRQPPGYDSDIEAIYRIDPATDLWLQVQTTYAIGGQKTVSIADFTPSPGLTLPTPITAPTP